MARYFLRYRHSDTGLSPTFTFFKKASDLSVVGPPPIGEVGSGTYYFDFSPTFDIVFEADGGNSIPTEEVRYISDTISPKDVFVDEPVSQVKDDVWNDAVNRNAGSKGDFVEQIGVPADTSAQATLFGKALLYKESIRGDTAGTGDGQDVEQVYDLVTGAAIGGAVWDAVAASHVTAGTFGKLAADTKGAVDVINVETDAASIANAVWNELIASHQTAGSMGLFLNNIFRLLRNKAIINAVSKQLEVYDDPGTGIIFTMDLKDEFGVASATRIFRRIP